MGNPVWKGPTNSLVEQPGSPRTEYSERASRTRTFKGTYTLCLSSALARGTAGTGADAGWAVASSVVTKERGNIGTLVITYEAYSVAAGAELPPSTFSWDPQRIARPLKYHPRYSGLTIAQLDQIDKALEADAVQGSTAYSSFQGTALALELYQKRKRGQETYYLAGVKYSYTVASWTMPAGTLGGFIQAPDGPMENALPASTSWLRLADELSWTGSYYQITRSWIGSPTGDWDADLYT